MIEPFITVTPLTGAFWKSNQNSCWLRIIFFPFHCEPRPPHSMQWRDSEKLTLCTGNRIKNCIHKQSVTLFRQLRSPTPNFGKCHFNFSTLRCQRFTKIGDLAVIVAVKPFKWIGPTYQWFLASVTIYQWLSPLRFKPHFNPRVTDCIPVIIPALRGDYRGVKSAAQAWQNTIAFIHKLLPFL